MAIPCNLVSKVCLAALGFRDYLLRTMRSQILEIVEVVYLLQNPSRQRAELAARQAEKRLGYGM